MVRASADSDEEQAVTGPRDPTDVLKRSLITGAAIILPLAVTLFLVSFLLQFVDNQLDPFIGFLQDVRGGPDEFSDSFLKFVTVSVILTSTFLLGFVAEFSTRGKRVGDAFDEFMAALPGIGPIYTSFHEMSEMLIDSDTDSFQEVKLVEFPGEGAYTIAFKTTDTPGLVEDAAGHDDMVTLFVPMAPNPVMGGFVLHVSKDRVVDVDLTVEEGITAIVTSGVAISAGDDESQFRGLTESEMRQLGRIGAVDMPADPGDGLPDVRQKGKTEPSDRVAEYEDAVSPQNSGTPHKIAERERDDRADGGPNARTDDPPAERAGRDADEQATTDGSPAEQSGRDESTQQSTDGTPAEEAGREDE